MESDMKPEQMADHREAIRVLLNEQKPTTRDELQAWMHRLAPHVAAIDEAQGIWFRNAPRRIPRGFSAQIIEFLADAAAKLAREIIETQHLEACPHCSEPAIDTSRPTANFWRCGHCRMAIVKRGGKLVTWLDPYQKPRGKRKAGRRSR